MRVVDSVGWVSYAKGESLGGRYAPHIEQVDDLITPTIVLYEVTKRMLLDAGEEAALECAARIRKTIVQPLDSLTAMAAAKLSIDLKLPMADAIIYATAQRSGATVVTSDEHFAGVPDVEFVERTA